MDEDIRFNWFPIIIVLVLYVLIIAAVILTNIYSNRDILEVCDKCAPNEVKYRYFIRMDLNPKTRKKFRISKDILTLRIYDKKKIYISSFCFKMALISSVPDLNNKSRVELKMIVNTKHRFSEWGYIKIESSSQRGTIYVYDIEMIGIDTKEHFEVTVNREITAPTIKGGKEMFVCNRLEWDPNSDTGKPPKFVLLNETLVILYMTGNMALLLFAILISLVELNHMLMAVISSLISFIIELLDIFFYRFNIKLKLWRTYGAHPWPRISLAYLILNFVIGVGSGSLSIILLFNNKNNISEELSFAMFLLIILNFLLLLLSYVMKCQLFNKMNAITSLLSTEFKTNPEIVTQTKTKP